MRPLLYATLAILLLVPDYSRDPPRSMLGRAAAIEATRVPLFPQAPGERRLGALTYLGGVQLTSPDRAFGGFSAMVLAGDQFTLLADGGNFVRFRLGRDWRLTEPEFGDLPGGPGTGWPKESRDSESLAADPATGRLWVGFERANAVYRFAPGLAAVEGSSQPLAMRRWPRNSGAEAMTRLADGRFLVIGEGAAGAGEPPGSPALMFAGDPAAAPDRGFSFTYRPPDDFSATDVAELPDGRLLVLVRRFEFRSGFSARLELVERAAVGPGAVVTGRELARFEAPAIHDNFEALAVAREGSDTVLWVASDDNAPSFFGERSLLLKFRLVLPPPAGAARTPTARVP